MKKLKSFDQLNEADIHDALPDDYTREVERKGRQQYGNGPTRQEMGEAMRLMDDIFRIQRGHEEELTEIGLEILKKNYPILNDIILDAKIVRPDDEEKLEMTQKMTNDDDDDDREQDHSEGDYANQYDVDDVNEDEVSKRKIINNLMQGESQNVHSMMHQSREEVDKISPRLIDLHMRHLELNKKFDWWDQANLQQSMTQMPEFTNAMETDYEEGKEEGETKPKIKARVLDLPMLIHEVVKGIYELIAANAIPEDSVTANKILKKTDTLEDEQQDFKYGPFIAADLRNYLNTHFEKVMMDYQSDNIKELIYGKLVVLPAKQFILVIKGMLLNEKDETFDTLKKIVNDCVKDLEEYNKPTYKGDEKIVLPHSDIQKVDDVDDFDDEELVNFMRGKNKPKQVQPPKEEPKKELTDKDYVNMSQGTLNNLLNKAMEDGDMETAKRIGKFLKD